MTLPTPARRVADGLLVLTVSGLDLLIWGGDRQLAGGGLLAWWVVPTLTGLQAAALLARHRWPLPVFALAWALAMTNLVAVRYQPFAGLLLALHAVATRGSARAAWSVLAASTLPFAVFAYQAARAHVGGFTPGEFLALLAVWAVLAAVVWGLGRLYHLRGEQARRERELQAREAELALEAERLRLARELHDSVTGAVTSMIMYAAGARAALGPADGPARDALGVVERAGTQAMNELHRLLGLLRTPDREPPAAAGGELAALSELAERARSAGLDVAVTATGDVRPLDPSVELAGYRVVQEALTNAAKHAGPGARVDVALDWRPDELRLDVTSAGGSGPVAVPSSGHGLPGLAERVHLVGGVFRAGPAADGWRVHADLPVVPSPNAVATPAPATPTPAAATPTGAGAGPATEAPADEPATTRSATAPAAESITTRATTAPAAEPAAAPAGEAS